MKSLLARALAIALTTGGLVGALIFGLLAVKLAAQSWALAFFAAAIIGLFGFSTFVGVRLWQQRPAAVTWAAGLFASQTPVISFRGLSYEWFTGLFISPFAIVTDGVARFGIHLNYGAKAKFLLDTASPETTIGVNLFAAAAVLCLLRLRANYSLKRTAAE